MSDELALRPFKLDVMGTKLDLPLPSEVPLDQVERYVYCLGAIKVYAEAAIKHWKAQADAGVEIPGMKLVQGRAVRSWKDETGTALVQRVGEDVAYERVLRSPAKLEAYLREEEGYEKAAAVKAVADLVEVNHGTMLVPESDRREAIPNRPQSVFAAPADDIDGLI